jgi:hypothetical protein
LQVDEAVEISGIVGNLTLDGGSFPLPPPNATDYDYTELPSGLMLKMITM